MTAEAWARAIAQGTYGRIAARVDLMMRLSARPCRDGECDDGGRCRRHDQDFAVAARYLRLRGLA